MIYFRTVIKFMVTLKEYTWQAVSITVQVHFQLEKCLTAHVTLTTIYQQIWLCYVSCPTTLRKTNNEFNNVFLKLFSFPNIKNNYRNNNNKISCSVHFMWFWVRQELNLMSIFISNRSLPLKHFFYGKYGLCNTGCILTWVLLNKVLLFLNP